MAEFDDLVASRKAWIADFLQPWCRSAPLAALKRAELDWADIAGKVTADKTLWPWARLDFQNWFTSRWGSKKQLKLRSH